MSLPTSLKSNKVITRALSILKRLTQLIECAKTEVEIGDHFRIARVRLTGFAWFGGHQWRAGHRDEEEHEGCAEDDGYDLVVHASEGVVLLVDVEEACDGCCGFNAHASCMLVPGSLTRAARLDVVLGDPWSMEEDNYLVVLHAARSSVVISGLWSWSWAY